MECKVSIVPPNVELPQDLPSHDMMVTLDILVMLLPVNIPSCRLTFPDIQGHGLVRGGSFRMHGCKFSGQDVAQAGPEVEEKSPPNMRQRIWGNLG
jgi:hypothetical protein